MLLTPNGNFGQTIQLIEAIKVDKPEKFRGVPISQCIIEGKYFLFTDSQSVTIPVFEKDNGSLIFKKELGPGFGKEHFAGPLYCFYNQFLGRLGVFDNGQRRILIFDRNAKNDRKDEEEIDFIFLKSVPCPRGGDDFDFDLKGNHVIVSGFRVDESGNPFDLYSINIGSEHLHYHYLLSSPEKYKLKTTENYRSEYREKQTLPAIGIKGFFDIQGDDLFFVWEGALRIIKIGLRSKKIKTYEYENVHYSKPDGERLSKLYKNGHSHTQRRSDQNLQECQFQRLQWRDLLSGL